MEHFRCTGSFHVVKIDRVLITKPIADAIRKGIGAESFADVKVLRMYKPKMLPNSGFSTPLNRIHNMVNIMGERLTDLPPIITKCVRTHCGEFFDIIDGRHRMAASVILGFDAIPITVV